MNFEQKKAVILTVVTANTIGRLPEQVVEHHDDGSMRVPNDRAYLTSEHTITSVHTLTSVHTFSHYLCSLVKVCSLVESKVKIGQKSMHTRYSMLTR